VPCSYVRFYTELPKINELARADALLRETAGDVCTHTHRAAGEVVRPCV